MRAGDLVTYVHARQAAIDAVVVAVTGSGPSGYKTLDIDVGKIVVRNVVHVQDDTGEGHWLATADYRAARPGRKKKDTTVPAPVVPESQDEGRATAGVGDSTEDV